VKANSGTGFRHVENIASEVVRCARFSKEQQTIEPVPRLYAYRMYTTSDLDGTDLDSTEVLGEIETKSMASRKSSPDSDG